MVLVTTPYLLILFTHGVGAASSSYIAQTREAIQVSRRSTPPTASHMAYRTASTVGSHFKRQLGICRPLMCMPFGSARVTPPPCRRRVRWHAPRYFFISGSPCNMYITPCNKLHEAIAHATGPDASRGREGSRCESLNRSNPFFCEEGGREQKNSWRHAPEKPMQPAPGAWQISYTRHTQRVPRCSSGGSQPRADVMTAQRRAHTCTRPRAAAFSKLIRDRENDVVSLEGNSRGHGWIRYEETGECDQRSHRFLSPVHSPSRSMVDIVAIHL